MGWYSRFQQEAAMEVHRLYILCMVYEYPTELAYLEYNSIARNEGHLTPIQAIRETQRRIFLRLPVSN